MEVKSNLIVSFIIIAYNADKYLDKALNSLAKQDYPHDKIEVLLVDSMSIDNTKQIFQEFEKNNKSFKRIKILQNPKKILPCGWNVALAEAQGDVVLRVDAHSFFNEDFITQNVKEIEAGEDIVGGKCVSVTQQDSKKEKLLLIAEESIFGAGIADFRRKEKREYVSTLAFAMYKKSVFDKVGKYNENLARTEDNEMHYRMKQAGFKFLLSPNIVTYRYARSDLKGMIKQKYGNGKWIGITMKYCPKCFSIYHFVPFAFVFSILACAVFSLLGINIFSYLLIAAYTLFNIASIVAESMKNKFKMEYLLLPFILLILHISYGLGTLIGFCKLLFNKK